VLEFYESDSSVEDDNETDAEDGGDAGAGPGAGGAAKRGTRSLVGEDQERPSGRWMTAPQ
jgi:hypothetical protein